MAQRDLFGDGERESGGRDGRRVWIDNSSSFAGSGNRLLVAIS